MNRYLFTTWEGGGNVTPAVEAARRLVARGHRVRFMSEECNRQEAEAAGATFLGWKTAPSRKDRTRASQAFHDYAAPTPQEGLLGLIHDLWCGPSLAHARDTLEELDREPADLVVTCETLVGVMAACESRGQRFVLLCPNISMLPQPGLPPLRPGLAPARSDEERAMHAEITRGLVGLFDEGLPALNAARAELGLPPLEHLFDQADSAHLELLGTSRAFDFPTEELRPKVRYVGPILSDPAWSGEWRSPWPEEDRRPLVAVGFSTTYQGHTAVLQRIIDALAPLPVRVLVTRGGSLGTDELHPADNTVVVEAAPHTRVMPEAALVVTHGGHGTVIRALSNGLPQLILPHGRDQADNAVRITERGAGLSLPPDAEVGAIGEACRRLLEEPEFRASAERLGAQVARDAAGAALVEELESAAAVVPAA